MVVVDCFKTINNINNNNKNDVFHRLCICLIIYKTINKTTRRKTNTSEI